MNVYVSPSSLIQADRILRIETPLGADAVLAERFELSEGIGGFEDAGVIGPTGAGAIGPTGAGAAGPTGAGAGLGVHPSERGLFSGVIAVRSPRHDIAADELVGRYIDVSVELSAEPPVRRTWHCLVSELLVGPPVTRGLRSYRLTLRPPHWLLTRRRDCRIWQNVTSVDVVRTLLGEHGLAAPVTSGVVGDPPPQAYSVQFNESDWAYACRRLEQDGIFWFTRHLGGEKDAVSATCDLHLASHVSGYLNAEHDDGARGAGSVRYAAGSTDRNHITRFDTAFRFVPGSRAGADWNFLTPGTVPGADDAVPSHVRLPGGALGSNADYESFEYPAVGGYGTGAGSDGASEGIDAAELDRLERLRAQAHEADHAQVVGEGTVRTLAPGQRFTPYDVPAEQGLAELLGSAADGATDFAEHVVLSITHRAVDQSYESQGGAPEYHAEFTALPAATPATPHRNTPRPRIDGQQIGIVAGPAGEEIHTDRYGRIKLWFPWDRRASKDGTDTCWVRVAQSWAGTGWGAQVIPRIGMEAVVSYLDGDPDRPIVTGLVPNPQQRTPYTLPENKTRTVMRSDSHKTGGFNELTFEDAGGRENLFSHAQKDRTERVLNDRTARVDRHDVYSVGGNRAVEVASNQKTEVGGSLNLTVGGTGPGALGALAGVMGLAGNTAGLLRQAGEIGGASGPTAAMLGAFGTSIAGSALGFLQGSGLGAREGVVAGANPRGDAGTALAGSGSGMGEAAGGLFPMDGIMNTVVQSFQSTSVGVAQTEQIGMSKVTNVGATHMTNVGVESRTKVGRAAYVDVGKLHQTVSGEKVRTEAKVIELFADDTILLSAPGGYIEINKRGIKLHGLRVDVEGNRINFAKGGKGEGASCLREMAKSATPFVRG